MMYWREKGGTEEMRIEGHAEVKGMLFRHEGPQMKRGRESDPLIEYALGPRIDNMCRTNVFPRDSSFLSQKEKQSRAELWNNHRQVE
ncbi:hypothetical protein CesoFtcFv8_022367 [Champsocephalus esox]|uniref:Uncharacterized protein n=1 Tax=Champsocephalus esox TaxID=159716 RepID=A0AAN8GKA3_9TELE|nr:hypothetical protein CesoFtcFv8_022367 [Champsocephalus esox]